MVVETAVTEAVRAEPLAECKATKRQPTANAWIFHATVWGIGGGSGSGSDDGSSDSGGGGGDGGGDGSSKCGGGGGGGLKLPPPLPFLPAVIKHDQHRNGIKSMAQHMHNYATCEEQRRADARIGSWQAAHLLMAMATSSATSLQDEVTLGCSRRGLEPRAREL